MSEDHDAGSVGTGASLKAPIMSTQLMRELPQSDNDEFENVLESFERMLGEQNAEWSKAVRCLESLGDTRVPVPSRALRELEDIRERQLATDLTINICLGGTRC